VLASFRGQGAAFTFSKTNDIRNSRHQFFIARQQHVRGNAAA
jgi:hypothetical protein